MKNFAFLSSTMRPLSVGRLRDAICKIDPKERIWVAERSAPEMKTEDWSHLEIIDRCLDEIDASERFILLVGPRFGTFGSLGEKDFSSSFTELELFYAVTNEKPIFIYHLSGETVDDGITKLVDVLTSGVREKRVFTGSPTEIVEYIRVLLEECQRPSDAGRRPLRDLSGYLASKRHADFDNTTLFKEIQLLDGEAVGTIDPQPDLDLIKECLSDVKNQSRTDRKMSRAWLAIRLLMGRHYRNERDDEILELWEEALRAWSQFAGWRGLHSHIWLGHIAALGSLHQVMQRRGATLATPATEEHGGDLFGAFGSVYYSLSKKGLESQKASFENRSLAYLSAGLETVDEQFRHGLFSIRGAVRLHRCQYRDAIQDFETALGLIERYGSGPVTAAIVSADLGFAEVRAGQWRQGRKRLETAVTEIMASDANPGFKARSLRKLAVARIATLSPIKGYQVATKAARLIKDHGLPDQSDAITRFAAMIDRVIGR